MYPDAKPKAAAFPRVSSPCAPCPDCGEPQKVRVTSTVNTGHYCYCDACGHMWFVDVPAGRTG
jgi:hypothetical protein